jgi:predicted DNA-binding transcriptional regulator AlpA
METLLTLPEVASRLRTPEATLRFWRHKGTGPKSFKVGRRVVYRETDVNAWLAEALASSTGRDDAA